MPDTFGTQDECEEGHFKKKSNEKRHEEVYMFRNSEYWFLCG